MVNSDSSDSSVPRALSTTTDGSNPRKVSFSDKARVSSGTKEQNVVKEVPTKTTSSKGSRSSTHETFSDVSSAMSGDSGGFYEVIEYDPSHQVRSHSSPAALMGPSYGPMAGMLTSFDEEEQDEYLGIEPTIEENTPAAEALKASASVKVSRVGKAARAVNMQAVRKLVKRATGTTKQGVVKGKPPRLPPPQKFHATGSEADGSESEAADDHVEHINEAHLIHQRQQDQQELERQREEVKKRARDPNLKEHLPDDVVAGTVEAGKKVLGAVDPHDMLKLLRWRKKKKGDDDRKPKSYVKGKVIDGEHELYTLSIAVMIGVRTSISKTNMILNSGPSKRWVLPQDYRATEKYEFRPKGGTGMPAHQLSHTFKFKDYAPVVFAYLRRMYGINEFDFLISVCGNANFIEFISNAKSGQFFFYSSDGRYMIKTMTNAESKFLRRILPEYFRHCCENPNTMVTRFFGMYRVKLYHLRRNVKFVIMNSVYYTDKYLQTFYDLKGSVMGRDAKPGQAVLKDNDLRRALPEGALSMPPKVRERVRDQIESDVIFLEKLGILDYSMLVGVHHVPPRRYDQSIATTGFRASVQKGTPQKSRSSSLDMIGSFDSTHVVREMGSRNASQPTLKPGTTRSERHMADEIAQLIFEDGLDDDENSYLPDSSSRPRGRPQFSEEIESKKLATIEKLYWPFHNWFDIHGHRRVTAPKSLTSEHTPCDFAPPEETQGYKIKMFEAPLSDRKDGGLEMDTTGLPLPLLYKGPNGDQHYEGKIFYMGIIDVLQEYTSRKMLEAQYRLLQTSGRNDASCVAPKTYGQRFVEFFDEYTIRSFVGNDTENSGVEMTLALHESQSGTSLEEKKLSSPQRDGESEVSDSIPHSVDSEKNGAVVGVLESGAIPSPTPAAENAVVPAPPARAATPPPASIVTQDDSKPVTTQNVSKDAPSIVQSSTFDSPSIPTKSSSKDSSESSVKSSKSAKSPLRFFRFNRTKRNKSADLVSMRTTASTSQPSTANKLVEI